MTARLSDEALAELKKHTPGPWRIGQNATGDFYTVWAAQADLSVASAFDNRFDDEAPPKKEAKVNATLIAFAPTLLSEVTETRALVKELVEALEKPVAKAMKLLVKASVFSCECGTKTGDPLYHAQDCRYRLITHAYDKLIEAYAALSRARKVSDDKA